MKILSGVAEAWDDLPKFSRIFQWFWTPVHPANMQRRTVEVFKTSAGFFLQNSTILSMVSKSSFLDAI
jgi:hypothetical protein